MRSSLRSLALAAVLGLPLAQGCKRSAEAPTSSAPSASTPAPPPAPAPPAEAPPVAAAPPAEAPPAEAPPVAAAPPAEAPPAEAPPVAAAPPPAAAACRALVLLATPSEPSAEGDADKTRPPPQPYTALDVRLGPAGGMQQAPGLLVRAEGRTFALQITRKEERGKEGRIAVVDTWDRLDAIDLASGARATWFEDRQRSAEFAKEMGDDDELGDAGFDAQSFVSVVGVVGPVVSFFHESTGYAGGAHGYDDTYVTARLAPAGGPLDVAAWAPDVVAAAAKEAQAVEKRRAAGEGGFEASSVTPEVLKRAGLGLDPANWMAGPLDEAEQADRAARPLGLTVYTRVECCSWAENHNQMDLSVGVALSDALAAQTGRPDATHKQLLVAPDGCGAVGLRDGHLLTRVGKEGEVVERELTGVTPAGLLGVYWIDGADPVDVTRLPPPFVAPSAP